MPGHRPARRPHGAATEGLAFDYGSSLAVNTLDSHRVLHLATELGVGGEAKERLLRAHFVEGADLSDPDTLAQLLSEVGVPADRTRAVLAGHEYEDAVRADIEEAQLLGCTGVPFFVIDRKYGIPGAQPAEVFLGALAIEEPTLARSRGAAINQACMALPYYQGTYPLIVERSWHKLAVLGVQRHSAR